MNLTLHEFNQVVDLLLSQMGDDDAHKALVESALFGCGVLDDIDWSGTARTFTIRLVQKLLDYGDCESGEPSLITLLEACKKNVGYDRQVANVLFLYIIFRSNFHQFEH